LKSLEVRGPVFSGGEIKLEFSLAVTPPADPETGYPQAAVLDFYSGGRKIGEKSLRLGEGIRRFVSGKVSLPAPEEAGEYWLHAIVRPLEGEWTAANNERLIKVTVSRDRRRIFLLSSSPDWDFYFMQRSLALDEDLEVQAMLALEPGHGGRLYRFRDSEGKFSAGRLPDAAALEDIELVVLHGEWARFDRSFLLRIADRAAQGSLALVFWPVGPLDTGEGLKKLARYLPFRDSRVSPPLVKGPDAPCVLFTTDRYGILKSLGRGAPINDLPPVDRVYRSLPLKASAVVLARTGREQAAATTPGAHKAKGEVLLAALQVGGTRVAAILGQGLWRWHMLSQDASVGRDNLYERLWAALAEWLLSGEKGEKLFLKPRRNVFLLGETVVFDGELGETAPGERDKESGTVMVTVWQEKDKGAADTVAALKVEARGEAGSLEVQLGRLQPGVYLYEAVAAGSGSPPLSSRGTFAAENYNSEMAEAGPDTTILAGLVRATKGKLTMDYKNAETKIRADEITEPVLKTYRLAYRVWVYLVLILLLSAEWALRRRKALA
ncbi:MAG: hypothetical protein U9N45_08130, partial [Gemmatimonadota bacterium]|nr:hypothetical protein [Gemmatimonadota bacterium]